MSFAILRTSKLKHFGNIGGSLDHNYRDIPTANADPSRTQNNQHSLANAELVKQAIRDRLPKKRRSDAVLAVEYLITASPEWDGWGTNKQQEFFNRSVEWLNARHGKANVIATSLHLDETTPHLVAYVVPLDEKNKLNCKQFLGGRQKLRDMQTSFAEKVADLGLERGIEGSKAQHTTIKQYYAAVNEPVYEFELDPKELPSKGTFESSEKFNQRVADEINNSIKPELARLTALADEVERLKKDLKDSHKSMKNLHFELDNLKKFAKPFLDGVKGLTSIQHHKMIAEAITKTRFSIDTELKNAEIAIEAQNKRLEEQKNLSATIVPTAPQKLPRELLEAKLSPEFRVKYEETKKYLERGVKNPQEFDEKLNQILENALKIQEKSQEWKTFVNKLPLSQQKIVKNGLKLLEKSNTPAEIGIIQERIMQNPDEIKNLPQSKEIER